MKIEVWAITEETFGKQTIDGTLESIYKILKCDCFDIATRYVDGRAFIIFCDDEGLLKPESKVSAVDAEGNLMFVGNLIFAHCDDEGETTGVSDKDVQILNSHVCMAKFADNTLGYVIRGVHY